MAPASTSAVLVGFSEENDPKASQPRNPFKELKLNGFGEDADEMKSRNCPSKDALTKWEEFEMSLTDSERIEMTPAIDDLISGITDDFLSSGFGGSFFIGAPCGGNITNNNISRQSENNTRSSAPKSSRPQVAKKAWGEKPIERSQSADQEVLIKASYSNHVNQGVSRANLSTMIAEKSSLKRELRSIDLEFEAREGRKPTKAEKEHLRPLYVRYWKLKHQIGKLQGPSSHHANVAAVH